MCETHTMMRKDDAKMVNEKALKRLRRKLEVLRLDCRRASDTRMYDVEECLALVELIEREIVDDQPSTDE